MVDDTEVVDKDAWLIQAFGSGTKRGNGTGKIIHVGRVPSGTSDPDYKSRGIFSVPLRGGGTGVLDAFSSLSAATFELTVGAESCIVGGRGTVFYAFLEEITGDFVEKSAATDCSVPSGSGTGVWGADSGATTVNRAFLSAPGLGSGDKISWNILAMAQAWLADGSKTVVRFRIIYANSAGTAYDESVNPPRAVGFHSLQATSSGDRPLFKVTGSTGSVAKSSSDTITISETQSITSTSTGAVGDDEDITISDAVVYNGPAPGWTVQEGSSGNGYGQVTLRVQNARTTALLNDVDEADVLMVCKFSLNKIPATSFVAWSLLARALDVNNYYELYASCISQNQIGLYLWSYAAGLPSLIGQAFNQRVLIANTEYWLKFLVQGSSPTTLAAKLWRDGEGEPPGYALTGQDSEAVLQASGTVGLKGTTGIVNNLPITIKFDDFEVTAP